MIEDFEERVAELVSQFDPRKDPELAKLRHQYSDDDWSSRLESTDQDIRLHARVAVFARAVGDEAKRLGLATDGHPLACFIAFDGIDALDTSSHDDLTERLRSICDRHSFAENDAYDRAEGALVDALREQALGSLDRELTKILAGSGGA